MKIIQTNKFIIIIFLLIIVSLIFFLFLKNNSKTVNFVFLQNKKIEFIFNKYGIPKKDTIFIINKNSSLYEIRYGLKKLINKNNQVTIRELYWKQGDFTTFIWFINKNKEWIVVDGLKYNNQIVKY